MARCIDYPACGHEAGCCPDFDDHGNQLNMVCICGKKLPITNRVSICDVCLRQGDEDNDFDSDYHDDDIEDEDCEPEYDDSMDGDHQSGLASAGWGTDEDYGGEDSFLDGMYEGE